MWAHSLNRSQFLAGLADQQTDRSDYVTTMLIDLDALPDPTSDSIRQRMLPLEMSAVHALDRAWRARSSGWIERAVLSGHTGSLRAVAFSPDGTRVLTGSADNTARLWPIFPSARDLVEVAKATVPRCLTSIQRLDFHLNTPTPEWCHARHLWPFDGDGQ